MSKTTSEIAEATERGWLLCGPRQNSVRWLWHRDCPAHGRPYVAVYRQAGAKTATLDYGIPEMTNDWFDPRLTPEAETELADRIGAAVQASPSRTAYAVHGALWGYVARIGVQDAFALAEWLIATCARPESFSETINPMLPDECAPRDGDRLRFGWVPERLR